MKHAIEVISNDEMDEEERVSWAAYHASKCKTEVTCTSLSQLLPLFNEHAASAAMVKHGIAVQTKAIQFLNPGQIPVIAFDAPLFALAKLVQWKWPDMHGEDKCVVMMGGLHIEMAFWSTVGDYLEGSGWVSVLTQSCVALAGTAESFLNASHLMKTRNAHQVSALALAILQERAFVQTGDAFSTQQEWKENMRKTCPMFLYWDTVLNLELSGVVFVRAHRERDFSLYLESLKMIAPWFFALDHYHYARWVPVHIRDMEKLPTSVHNEFYENGHWVVQKTKNRFSAMPIDQAHEQNNALVKGSGGAIGLLQNPVTLRKWLLAGPEQA